MEESQVEQAKASCIDEPKRNSSSIKLVSGALLFCVLTFSVFYYQFSRIQEGGIVFSWRQLQFQYLGFLIFSMPFDTLASAFRIWLVCRALEQHAGFWTCLKAEWANVGVAMLTPSQTGGGLGQIYILTRSGIGPSTAVIISLISFLGTMVGLLCVGFYTVLHSGASLKSCFSLAVWPLTLVLGLMSLPILWPGLFRVSVLGTLRVLSAIHRFVYRVPSCPGDGRSLDSSKLETLGARLIDLAHQYHSDAWKFIRKGSIHFVAICLLSLMFIMARCCMAFFCLRFLGVEASCLGEVIKIQMALIFLLYFAPTPGSSGLAELFSFSAMAAIIPSGFTAYYNLLWRASTLYLPAVLGLIFLSLTLFSDARCAFRRKASSLIVKPCIQNRQ